MAIEPVEIEPSLAVRVTAPVEVRLAVEIELAPVLVIAMLPLDVTDPRWTLPALALAVTAPAPASMLIEPAEMSFAVRVTAPPAVAIGEEA